MHNETRNNPVQQCLNGRNPQWMQVAGMPTAAHVDGDPADAQAVGTVALCDVSTLTKLGLKGSGAADWLAEQGVNVPSAIYSACPLGDQGWNIRVGSDEFFLESGLANVTVPALEAAIAASTVDVRPVERQDATFLVTGPRSLDLLGQTCGVDFRKASRHCLVMTRVAGVSCGIFPDATGGADVYRLWLDPSYAVYLWETLEQICIQLGGQVVGAACLYPDLR